MESANIEVEATIDTVCAQVYEIVGKFLKAKKSCNCPKCGTNDFSCEWEIAQKEIKELESRLQLEREDCSICKSFGVDHPKGQPVSECEKVYKEGNRRKCPEHGVVFYGLGNCPECK